MAFNFLPLALGGANALGAFLAREEAQDTADDAARILQGGQDAALGPSLGAVQAGEQAQGQAIIDAQGNIVSSTNEAMEVNEDALERSLDFIDPELVAARGAQNLLNDATGVNGPEAQQAFFDNFQNDPGFQRELQERVNALDRSAASRGMLLSGGQLRAVGDEGQRFARSAFQDRLGRLQTQAAPAREIAGRGAGLITGAGQRAQDLTTARGRNLANLDLRRGESRAGAAMARGNILGTSALNRADIGANRRLARGEANQRFVNSLTTAGGAALGSVPSSAFRLNTGGPFVPDASSFPGATVPGERLRGRV